MIPALRDFLRAITAPAAPQEEIPVELATAVLLVEAMRADQGMQDEERAALMRILETRFSLHADDVRELLASAEDLRWTGPTDLFPQAAAALGAPALGDRAARAAEKVAAG